MTRPAAPAAAAQRVAAVALLGCLLVARASAQPADRPFVVPQHDVDVVYGVPVPVPPGAPARAPMVQRMRFSAATARQRVDPPGNGTYMITDYEAGRMIVVQPAQRLATILPAPGGPIAPHGVPATGDYRRLGQQTIAGFACTDWNTRDVSGRESIVCLTADGVMLRAMQDNRVLVQATHIEEVPQPAALFAIPDGDRTQTAPAR